MGLCEFNPAASAATSAAAESEGHISLPCPGFEGFEKRLDVQFSAKHVQPFHPEGFLGLRAIPREELDVMLSAAACTIVSRLSNEYFDSYVLSESSLFIYPDAIVIKTCGTTQLLNSIPHLLSSAATVGLFPTRCRYTRGCFIFPDAQPETYRDFATETEVLEGYFGHLGGGGRAFVMGDRLKKQGCWHVYVADADGVGSVAPKVPTFTLEVCMTELDRDVARQFFADSGLGTAKDVTRLTGIGGILPRSQIDDFSFEPCGYSMNGIEGRMHSTIHITPEDGFSYASFETRGYADENLDLGRLVRNVLDVFKPGCVSVALHVDSVVSVAARGVGSWGASLADMKGYVCCGSARQSLPHGSAVVFHNMKTVQMAGGSAKGVHPHALCVPSELPVASGAMSCSSFVPLCGAALAAGKCSGMCDKLVEEVAYTRGPAVADVLFPLHPTKLGAGEREIDRLMRQVIVGNSAAGQGTREGAFYVMDVAEVLRLWDAWAEAMPRVMPYYAVKCNPDPTLLGLLASLGAGFDVASKAELEAVTAVCGGTAPVDRIIFANPCKLPSHIDHAARQGLHLSTFDSESELFKLKKSDPRGARAVLRFRADDVAARCPLGVKYGAEFGECRRLLYVAKRLGVKVEGVAFHVGSGASDASAFAKGIATARTIFEMAEEMGLPQMTLLDVGGGFTADGAVGGGLSFADAAEAVSAALEDHFPAAEFPHVKVIAEPGRYFAETPFTLAAHVFGTRARGRGARRRYEYWINDGIYGSMNSLLYDHAVLSARPLRVAGKAGRVMRDRLYSSTVFGPTCDGLDTVLREVRLPRLHNGDWLIFPRMGAYTKAAGSSFNGFATADIPVAAYAYTSSGTSALPEHTFASHHAAWGGMPAGIDLMGSWDDLVIVGEEEWGVLEGCCSDDEYEDGMWGGGSSGSSSGSDTEE